MPAQIRKFYDFWFSQFRFASQQNHECVERTKRQNLYKIVELRIAKANTHEPYRRRMSNVMCCVTERERIESKMKILYERISPELSNRMWLRGNCVAVCSCLAKKFRRICLMIETHTKQFHQLHNT